MIAVMTSIQPKWCDLIASGKKTVEVRKTRPKTEEPFKCYIYCTKPICKFDWALCSNKGRIGFIAKCNYDAAKRMKIDILSGKVIGEFVCNYVEKLDKFDLFIGLDEISDSRIAEYSCVDVDDLLKYKGEKEFIYGWHISDLKIYDKPKELSDFKKIRRDCGYADLGLAKRDCSECNDKECFMSRPPQSWCYVEELPDDM